MRLDQFNNPIFNEADIFDALYVGHQEALSKIIAEDNSEILKFCELSNIKFTKLDPSTYDLSVEEYDKLLQKEWFMPTDYYNFDIEQYCISKCSNHDEHTRVTNELAEYKNRGMIPLLQWLKYFVDTCIANNIVWGVGRGSSVSSFVLFLIGVHKIHSIKYNLDWQDFLR
jgi:DNA polymerase III alpha subunit